MTDAGYDLPGKIMSNPMFLGPLNNGLFLVRETSGDYEGSRNLKNFIDRLVCRCDARIFWEDK